MSTRKRGRLTCNANDDEDELSPSTPASFALSAVKRRKLNTYGSTMGPNLLSTLANVFSFARSEKENFDAAQRDEIAHEQGSKEKDIWEVPDDEKPTKILKSGRREATSTASRKRTPLSRGKGQTESANSKIVSARNSEKDIYDIDTSEDDMTTRAGATRMSDMKCVPNLLNCTSEVRNEAEEIGSSKRGRGRPPKRFLTYQPSFREQPGKSRKSDTLKKTKRLSREASFQAMAEAGHKAAKESDDAQISTRQRSARSNVDVEDMEELTCERDVAEGTTTSYEGGAKEVLKVVHIQKGILTPTKNRSSRIRKCVAFQARDKIELGFEDYPGATNNITRPKKRRKSNQSSEQNPREFTSASFGERETAVKINMEYTNDAAQLHEDEDIDIVACAVCRGLDSKKGNEMIVCERCDFAVHLRCSGIPRVPTRDWLCEDCEPDDKDFLLPQADAEVAPDKVFNGFLEIEGLDDHLQLVQRILLDKLTGQKRIRLRGHDEEMRKVYQLIEQTVVAGEGNSMLIIGARGCGKTTLVESVVSDLSDDYQEVFHVVRLNGFIHTDDRLALKEIWRQLGREMDAEDEMTEKVNHADTLASLLALLSHPSEVSKEWAGEIATSVVFILDEFDLFTAHPRQTLLYNLFDIAQAKKAPIVVLGLTTRIDVVETLEKRVKSRFSHRYVHLSSPRSLAAFWDICKEGLLVEKDELQYEDFDPRILDPEKFVNFWHSAIEDLYTMDAVFMHHLQSHFYRSKSVPAFFSSCILPIANLSARNFRLTGFVLTSSVMSLSPPDSKLHIIEGLSELELALLISAARLDIILDTDTCNFSMAYDEYSSLISRHKLQTSSSGITALGSIAKLRSKDVAMGAWERLAEYGLLVPAGIGGATMKTPGKGGRLWKVDVGLEEITGSVKSMGKVLAKWCKEI